MKTTLPHLFSYETNESLHYVQLCTVHTEKLQTEIKFGIKNREFSREKNSCRKFKEL